MATLSRRARTEATRRATEGTLIAATIARLEAGIPFADLSIEQIVGAAGYSRPTFYAYFRDKRQLILRMGDGLRRELSEAADPWLRGDHEDLAATLAAVLQAFRRHRATTAALVEAATYDPAVSAFWRNLHHRFIPMARERISRSDPQVDEAHAQARAYTLVWMTERTMTEHLDNPTVGEDALLDELTRLWRQGTRTGS